MKIFCDIGNIKINLKSVKLFSHCVQIRFHLSISNMKIKKKMMKYERKFCF